MEFEQILFWKFDICVLILHVIHAILYTALTLLLLDFTNASIQTLYAWHLHKLHSANKIMTSSLMTSPLMTSLKLPKYLKKQPNHNINSLYWYTSCLVYRIREADRIYLNKICSKHFFSEHIWATKTDENSNSLLRICSERLTKLTNSYITAQASFRVLF